MTKKKTDVVKKEKTTKKVKKVEKTEIINKQINESNKEKIEELLKEAEILGEHKELEKKEIIEQNRPKTIDDVRAELMPEINQFINKMVHSGRARMYPDETCELERLYNAYYGVYEKIGKCDICGIRMFSRLQKLVK